MKKENKEADPAINWGKYYALLAGFLVLQIFSYYLFTQYFK
ncbi:MAG: hypothetical protein NWQ46_06085 [Spirosomaceae bacterium]|nr:hypothetical protein [Spirosomataceae bacterium]